LVNPVVGAVTYESVTGPRVGQLSDVVGAVHEAVCVQLVLPAPVLTETLAGQVIVGGILSTKNTVNVQLEKLPATSVAVKVIGKLLVEAPNTVPDGGDCVTTILPGGAQLSDLVAL
jgi:hypothetical protein